MMSTEIQNLKVLNSKEYESYLKNGYLIIENFMSESSCQTLMQHMKMLMDQFNPDPIKTIFTTKTQKHIKEKYFLDSGDKIHFFFEENAFNENGILIYEKSKSINKIGHALHDLDPVFNAFSRQPKIASLAKDIGIREALLIQSMYICKQPFIGGDVNCHQDATYLYAEHKPIVGLWFALEDATIENGCLWAIPGGHHTKLKSRLRRHNDETRLEIYDEAPWQLEKMIPLEVTAGSLIVLHGLLPHMSKANLSSHSRHAYTLHLADSDANFAKDNWLQRDFFNGF